jgi:predicted nucleic acid-binding protein
MELSDTSAWHWSERAPDDVRRDFASARVEGRIAVSGMVALELLRSTRNVTEFRAVRRELQEYPYCTVGEDEWARALDVYEALAAKGGTHQRSVKHPDLLIAAAAESAAVPVVHYDEDFDRIAAVTGQPTRWLAPRGSL